MSHTGIVNTVKLTTMQQLVCLSLLALLAGSSADRSGQTVTQLIIDEGSDVILPCSVSTEVDITTKVFDWKKDRQTEVFFYDQGDHYNKGRDGQDQQFKGRVEHFPNELTSGNASIIISNTKVADSGNYTCIFPNLQEGSIVSSVQLVVISEKCETPGISVRDVIMLGIGLLVGCAVGAVGIGGTVIYFKFNRKESRGHKDQSTTNGHPVKMSDVSHEDPDANERLTVAVE